MPSTMPDLAAIADLASEHPQLPEPTLRDLVYHAEPRLTARGETIPPNGFAPCIVRIGRRVLIDRDAFAVWIEQRRAAPISELNRASSWPTSQNRFRRAPRPLGQPTYPPVGTRQRLGKAAVWGTGPTLLGGVARHSPIHRSRRGAAGRGSHPVGRRKCPNPVYRAPLIPWKRRGRLRRTSASTTPSTTASHFERFLAARSSCGLICARNSAARTTGRWW